MALSQIALAPGIRVIDLGELSVLLAADRSITDAQRLAYQGAIRTLCKVLACRPEAIPADPRKIDQLLNDVAAANVPAAARPISRKTLANVRSRLKAALRVGQSASKMPPHGTILTPAWRALHVQLIDLRMRHGLSRLVRVASFRGIAPDQVDDPFVREVVDDVSRVNWGRDGLPFWRRTVALWNEAAATIAGWPQVALTPPAPPTRHLPNPSSAFRSRFATTSRLTFGGLAGRICWHTTRQVHQSNPARCDYAVSSSASPRRRSRSTWAIPRRNRESRRAGRSCERQSDPHRLPECDPGSEADGVHSRTRADARHRCSPVGGASRRISGDQGIARSQAQAGEHTHRSHRKESSRCSAVQRPGDPATAAQTAGHAAKACADASPDARPALAEDADCARDRVAPGRADALAESRQPLSWASTPVAIRPRRAGVHLTAAR